MDSLPVGQGAWVSVCYRRVLPRVELPVVGTLEEVDLVIFSPDERCVDIVGNSLKTLGNVLREATIQFSKVVGGVTPIATSLQEVSLAVLPGKGSVQIIWKAFPVVGDLPGVTPCHSGLCKLPVFTSPEHVSPSVLHGQRCVHLSILTQIFVPIVRCEGTDRVLNNFVSIFQEF